MPEQTLIGAADTATTADTTSADTSASQQTTQASTTPVGFTKPDGNFEDGWLDRLPAELKAGHPTLAKYRDLPSLAKSHVALQTMLGNKSSAVNIPTEKSTPEEVAAFRKALGVPETAEGYKLFPEQLPDGFVPDKELAKGMSEIAHKYHLPAKAMEELSARYIASQQASAEVATQQALAELEQGKEALKTSWGTNYDKNLGLAIRAAKTVGLDPNSAGLRDPEVVKALSRFASMMSEDKLVGGEFSPSLQLGKSRAKDIRTNPSNPLYQKYQQGDAETVELCRALDKNG